MKKTTTLVACVSMFCAFEAAAATTITSAEEGTNFLNTKIWSNESISSTTTETAVNVATEWGSKTNNSYTLTATLDVKTLATYIGKDSTKTAFSPFMSVSSSSYSIGAGAGKTTTANGITLAAKAVGAGNVGGNGYTPEDDATTPNPISLSTLDFSTISAAGVTLVHADGSGSTVFLTLVDTDNQATTYYGADNGLMWGGGFGNVQTVKFDKNLVTSLYLMADTATQNVAYVNLAAIDAAKAVPEPATATLSLLALAGLAARRRRK